MRLPFHPRRHRLPRCGRNAPSAFPPAPVVPGQQLQNGYIESFFRFTGFQQYFTDYECEGRSQKPKAENIRDIITRHQLAAPVYIGDTKMDEASAKLAGCPFIHAAYGFGSAKEPLATIKRR